MMRKIAAIDIGSNAVRLLITSVEEELFGPSFKKISLIRIPLRLGEDSFSIGKITHIRTIKLIKAMKSFKNLMDIYEVECYRACATAAMRDAKNGKKIIGKILEKAKINVEIIDGSVEAKIIYESHMADRLNSDKTYLYVDVGGGSTEISLITNGELVRSKTYNIGTVRLLNNKVKTEEYEKLHVDLEELKEQYEITDIIGSGGNIIKLNTLAKVRKDRKLSLTALEALNENLKQYTVEELIEKYELKPDRADIITLAADIYIDVAKSVGAKSFIVPKIGLIDGIVHILYTVWKEKRAAEEKKKEKKREKKNKPVVIEVVEAEPVNNEN